MFEASAERTICIATMRILSLSFSVISLLLLSSFFFIGREERDKVWGRQGGDTVVRVVPLLWIGRGNPGRQLMRIRISVLRERNSVYVYSLADLISLSLSLFFQALRSVKLDIFYLFFIRMKRARKWYSFQPFLSSFFFYREVFIYVV